MDASRALNESGSGEFYDILHCDRERASPIAKFLADHLIKTIKKLDARDSKHSFVGGIGEAVSNFKRSYSPGLSAFRRFGRRA